MSYMHNTPWTASEKVDLLVNVLQSAFPDLPSFLLQIIHENGVYPKWTDMPLPNGRSLHSSQIAFEEMSRLYRQQGRQPQQQQQQQQQPPPAQYTPTQTRPPPLTQPRQLHESEPYYTQQRALQPRPPRSTDSPVPIVTNGESMPSLRPMAGEPLQEVRKKRGRPSKEEAEERDRALAAEGKVYQPKKRATKKFRASTGTPGTDPKARDEVATPSQTPKSRPLQMAAGSAGPSRVERTPDDDAIPLRTGAPGTKQEDEQSDAGPAVAQSPSDRLLANHRERQPSPLAIARSPARGPSEGRTTGR